jgi:hypothetical protein
MENFLTFFINIKIIVLWSSKSIKFNQMKMYLLFLFVFLQQVCSKFISGTVTDSDAQSVMELTLKSLDDAGTVTDEGNLL